MDQSGDHGCCAQKADSQWSSRVTHLCRRRVLRTLDNLSPLPFDADEENNVGLGQFLPFAPDDANRYSSSDFW